MRRPPRAAALLAAAALACAPERPPATGVTDDAGRPVALAAPARRIVSLSPATTELLFDLGAGDRVVGRTRWCQDPPAARDVPSVGDGLPPNVEAVIARRPDLVVFYHSPSNAPAVERLRALGIATASVRVDRLDDFVRAARLLGRVTGTADRADSLVRALRDSLTAVTASHAPRPEPSVLILAWDNPPIVIGAGSFLSEIVALAGGRNAFADLAEPSATVSIETIAARDPDVVFVVGAPAFAERPEWQVVAAVRERRFARVEGTAFQHPSFRAPAAVRELRGILDAWRP